jgi:uncharacterized protein YecT (DUF1311 family)
MLVRPLLAALVAAVVLGVPVSASAADDFVRASSSALTLLHLCGKAAAIDEAGCKAQPYDALAGKMEEALQAALAKAPARVRPLLKRDQAWFNEMVLQIAQSMPQENADFAANLLALLKQRTETLATIAPGFARPGLDGRWVDAFGSATVTPAERGAYRVAIDTQSDYRAGDETVWDCHLTAELAPGDDGWRQGMIPAEPKPAHIKDGIAVPAQKQALLKMRRQGETLRIVVDASSFDALAACRRIDQVTATYFASGAPDAATASDKSDTSFVAPSFDCTRPSSASDEEICADPELADNDVRLNRAWKALQSRLDDPTRRALAEDQRHWVQAQIWQYPEHLHPAWAKRTYFMHHTVDGRDQLKLLQRERIALLEGFDEGRKGLAGTWLGYTAILKVNADGDSISADGWKWTQGDWKGGCDYAMEGKVVSGVFLSDEERVNPDTLERDHATLIVNRKDDAFAKKRFSDDGKQAGDEPKCKRNGSLSSTTRLFPVRPSLDIDRAQNAFR